jgi:uncharacterized membrane protein YdjX (TVP38/TMEM64 family)
MEVFLESVITTTIGLMSHFGLILGILIIFLESIIPILPLGIFITLNMFAYGKLVGFILSWVGTIMGCIVAFMASRKWFRAYVWDKIGDKKLVVKFMNFITDIKFSQLLILVALPFTPAFIVNIGAGLSKIPLKKFVLAIIIGKISIVYFWGYIGTGIIESIKNPYIVFQIIAILVVAYILSRILSKNFNIE